MQVSRLAIILGALQLLACGFISVARAPRWQALYAQLGIPLPRATTWCFVAAHAGGRPGADGWRRRRARVIMGRPRPLHRTVIGVCALVVAWVLAILTYAALIRPMMTLITTTPGG